MDQKESTKVFDPKLVAAAILDVFDQHQSPPPPSANQHLWSIDKILGVDTSESSSEPNDNADSPAIVSTEQSVGTSGCQAKISYQPLTSVNGNPPKLTSEQVSAASSYQAHIYSIPLAPVARSPTVGSEKVQAEQQAPKKYSPLKTTRFSAFQKVQRRQQQKAPQMAHAQRSAARVQQENAKLKPDSSSENELLLLRTTLAAKEQTIRTLENEQKILKERLEQVWRENAENVRLVEQLNEKVAFKSQQVERLILVVEDYEAVDKLKKENSKKVNVEVQVDAANELEPETFDVKVQVEIEKCDAEVQCVQEPREHATLPEVASQSRKRQSVVDAELPDSKKTCQLEKPTEPTESRDNTPDGDVPRIHGVSEVLVESPGVVLPKVNYVHIPILYGFHHTLFCALSSMFKNECGHDVIDHYMQMISKRNTKEQTLLPKIFAFSSVADTKDKKLVYLRNHRRKTVNVTFDNYDIIMVPVLVKNFHWTLVTIHLDERYIKFHEQFPCWVPDVLAALLNFMMSECGVDLSYFDKKINYKIPRANNTCDSGVFLCQFADSVARRQPIVFKKEDMDRLGSKMISEIASSTFLPMPQ